MADAPGFETDIKPLFREKDRRAMLFAFDLHEIVAVRDNAGDILAKLEEGDMPCDGAWPVDRIALFRAWQAGGMQP